MALLASTIGRKIKVSAMSDDHSAASSTLTTSPYIYLNDDVAGHLEITLKLLAAPSRPCEKPCRIAEERMRDPASGM